MPIKSDNGWYLGKRLVEAVNAFGAGSQAHTMLSNINSDAAKTVEALNDVADTATPEEQAEIASVLEEMVESITEVVQAAEANPFFDAAKKGKVFQAHQEARQYVLGESKDHTVSVQQKKTEHAQQTERRFVLVGEVKDHVDQLQTNTANALEKARIKWSNKTLIEKISSIISSFISSVQSAINNFVKFITNDNPEANHAKGMKAVHRELLTGVNQVQAKTQDRAQHKENFKPTVDALKTNADEARLMSSSKPGAPPKNTSTTNKYRKVLDDINKGGVNEEGHSSNLKSNLRGPGSK